jgi:threonine dehydrogenase-like Zn-dependent dehydrogenase
MVNSKLNKDYWHEALDLISSKTLDLKSLITNRISLEEAVDAFKYYDREKWIKIIVEPQK